MLGSRVRADPPAPVALEYASKLLQTLGAEGAAPAATDIRDAASLALAPITGRELEVLRLLDSELSNREIANRLFVSLDTVKSHTKHLYAKLGVHNRHLAVSRARDLKLL
jgi:LuxR family transcriptional regulator, maltose regulon positive regulatory protein